MELLLSLDQIFTPISLLLAHTLHIERLSLNYLILEVIYFAGCAVVYNLLKALSHVRGRTLRGSFICSCQFKYHLLKRQIIIIISFDALKVILFFGVRRLVFKLICGVVRLQDRLVLASSGELLLLLQLFHRLNRSTFSAIGSGRIQSE